MKKKTYILTFLMMLCSFVFGQDYHWEKPDGWQQNMVIYGNVTINGVAPDSNLDLELGAFCGNELRGREKVSRINDNKELIVYGAEGHAITFKLYDCTNNRMLDEYECSVKETFKEGEFVFGKTFNFTGKNHWNPSHNTNSNMTITARVTIDGDNVDGDYEIGAFIGENVCGSARVNNSIAYIVISANVDDHGNLIDANGQTINENNVTFKLWNHKSNLLANEITDVTVNYEHNATYGSQENPFVINFNEAVAEVAGEKFATLQAAVNATTTTNTEVKVLRDFVLDNTVTIAENQTVVLNLGGKTVTTAWENESAGKHYYAFTNNGTLTIQGNGTINARGIFNYGTMTLTEGTINAIDGNGGYGVRNYDGSVFTMNGGTIATTNEDDNKVDKGGYDATTLRVDEGATAIIEAGVINNICDFTLAAENYGKMTIKGGTFTSVHTTLGNHGEMTIERGTFTCNGKNGVTSHVLWTTNGSKTTINGGKFDGKDNYNGFNVDAEEGAVVIITGGEFLQVNSGSLYGNGTITVSGGTFFDKVADERLAQGYICEKEGEVYKVVRGLKGSGTEEKPFIIMNLNDLVFFRDHVNGGGTKYNATGKWVALGANIDMEYVDWSVNIGDNANNTFDGIFDGKGFTLSNLKSTETSQKSDGYVCTGLFGAIAGDAVVKNLTIENVDINTANFTGNNVAAVVGWVYTQSGKTAVISNVTVKGDVKINATGIYGVGTIVGYSYPGGSVNVTGCKVIANDGSVINAISGSGAIIGYCGGNATIKDCVVENIDVTAQGLVGGVTGIVVESTSVLDNNTVKNATLTATKAQWVNGVAVAVGTMVQNGLTVSNTTSDNVNVNNIVGSVYAEQPTSVVPAVEARIGDKYYKTLEDALAAANENDIITLLVPYTVEAGETLTIDKNVTYTSNVLGEAMITNKGELIINGKVSYTYTGAADNTYAKGNYTINNSGELVVGKNAVVEVSSGSNGKFSHALYAINNSNTLTINGTVQNANNIAIRQIASSNNAVNLTINEGTVKGTRALWIQLPSNNTAVAPEVNVNIKGGNIIGEGPESDGSKLAIYSYSYGNDMANVKINIEGGEFTGDVALTGGANKTNIETVNISGGTFKGDVYSYGEDEKAIEKITISGGTFATNDAEMYAEDNGYIFVWNETDKYYHVTTGQYVAQIGNVRYASLEEAVAAAQTGETIVLLENIELQATTNITKSITIDGNDKTLTQVVGVAEDNHAFLYIDGDSTLDVTIKNITFDGIKGSAVRTLDANVVIDNCVFQNGTHTGHQGVVRLTQGNATVKNSKFLNNTCTMALSFNYDAGNATDMLVVEDCLFKENTVNGTAALYYVKGEKCTIKDSEFISNTVNCSGNGATVYLGFTENNVVTGNLFKENVVTEATESTRVAGAIFFGYESEISGNAFDNNTASNAASSVLGQVCTSTYYDCEIDLSGNYWNTVAPVYGRDYTVQHQTGDGTFVLDNYYTSYTYENDVLTLDDEATFAYVAQVGKFKYTTVTAAINAAEDGGTVQLLAGTIDEVIKPWAGDATHASEKSITILGAENFGTTLTGGLYLGYDDSGCREHTITIEGIAFEGKGILVAGQQNVVIEGNKFTNITDVVSTSQSANANAISVIGKNVNATVKNNIISGVNVAGINLRDVANATVEGNTITDTKHNAITITETAGDGAISVVNNKLSQWGLGEQNGRAIRISANKVVNINDNVMSHTAAPESFVKVTGLGTEEKPLNVDENYWNGNNPIALFETDGKKDPVSYLLGYYKTYEDNTLKDYVELSASVAKIGDVYYQTLAEAFAAATNGQTIVMLTDVTVDSETYTIADGKAITLDMAGKKITVTDNKTSNYELFYVYGDLTVTGNGTITMTATNNRGWNASSSIFHNRGGVLTVANGTFAHNGGTDMAYVIDNSGNWYGEAITNVQDGTFTSTYIAIRNRMEQNEHGASGKAILNVYGGTINGTSRAIWAQAASTSTVSPATGEINISGGTIGLIDTPRNAGAVSMTTVTGGTVAAFKGEASELRVVAPGSITGDVTIMNAAGEVVEYAIDATGLYVEAFAKIENVNYASLQDAVNAAQNGDEIVVIKDFTVTTTVVVDETVSIDLNGKTITGSEVMPVIRIQGNASVTVENGNITNNDGYIFILGASDSSSLGNLTIKGSKYHGATSVASVTYGTLTVEGGEFSVEPYEGSYAYLINCIDANYTNGEANVVIKGGIFHNWNPENNAAEGEGTNFCDASYYALEVETGLFFVLPKTEIKQSTSLDAGWNWFSLYVDLNGETGLGMLRNSLTNGLNIKNQDEFTNYDANEQQWYGSLFSVKVNDMYMINVGSAQTIELNAYQVNPADYEFTLNSNWTWIGYPSMYALPVSVALEGFSPTVGDRIKSQDAFAEYTENEGWQGSLMTMDPGEGFMYFNKSGERTLIYSATNGYRGEVPAANITAANNLMVPNMTKYANNMNITAVVNIDGEELMTEDFEVAVFAGEELRGSARPIYIESIDRYMLFITVYGEENEELTFKYYDLNSGEELSLFADSKVMFEINSIIGSVEQPSVLNYGTLSIDETSASSFNVYPNPVNRDNAISFETTFDKVEVYNSLGVVVAEYANVDKIDGIETAGIYVIKVKNDNVVKYCRVIVK